MGNFENILIVVINVCHHKDWNEVNNPYKRDKLFL